MAPKYERVLPYHSEKPLSTIGETPDVPGWPDAPQILKRQSLAATIWDFILCVIPLLFAAVGIISIKISQTPISDLGEKVQQLLLLLPTIFPITFAATLGGLLKRVSLWRIEKGISVGLIEQLQGSVTLTSTLQLAWLLRSFRPISFVLVLIWVLSPLGGQAGLRILSIDVKSVQSDFSLYYPGPTAPTVFSNSMELQMFIDTINAVFTASILADIEVQNSFVDSWGNVKIPLLETMNTLTADEQGWISTNQSNITYASLVGVPVVPVIPAVGFSLSGFNNTNYTMEVSYYFMDCPQAISVPYEPYFNLPRGQVGINDSTYQTLNFTTNPPDLENGNYSSINISLASLYNSTMASVAECALHTSNVEVNVSCIQSSCGVAYIRQSPSSPLGYSANEVIKAELNYLPSATGLVEIENISSLIEEFLYNSSNVESTSGSMVDLTQVSSNDLSVRFTQLFNTTYIASVGLYLIDSPETELDYISGPSIINLSQFNQTLTTSTNDQSVYVLHNIWIIILFLCVSILFGAAVWNAVLGRIGLAPDLVGYASTLTRDDPNISLPPSGSTLSGIDRALLLKDARIQIGDVRKGDRDEGTFKLRLGRGIAGLGKRDKNKVYGEVPDPGYGEDMVGVELQREMEMEMEREGGGGGGGGGRMLHRRPLAVVSDRTANARSFGPYPASP